MTCCRSSGERVVELGGGSGQLAFSTARETRDYFFVDAPVAAALKCAALEAAWRRDAPATRVPFECASVEAFARRPDPFWGHDARERRRFVATGGGGATADQRRAVAARVAHFDAFWLLGDGFGDGFRAAAEARDCAAPPPAGAPPADVAAAVVCPSGHYGSTAMAWQAGRVANAFGERYVVGERRPHRAVAAALVPCLANARGDAVEILADDPLWREFTAEAALQRFVASPPFRAASSGETAATVAARHVAACQRWDALCVSQNVSTHAPCRGVLSGQGAPGEVACVLHAVARGRSGAFSTSTALASCAGDLLAAPKPHARPRPPQPDEALVKRVYELDAVLGNPRRLCHLGARVLSPASYWLAATRPHLEIVILAVPGESSTREELLVLERLAHLLPHRFLKAVTLNAEAALAAPSLDALRGTCDVFYADLWKLRSLNETDYAAMATFLRHRRRSRLVVPGVFDGPVPWPHQSPGGRFYLSDSRSKPPEQPTIRHFKCVDFAASDAAGEPVMALGACERSVGPNWVGFGGFRRLDVPDVASPPRRDTRRNISTPPAADADAVFAAAGNDAGYCDYALVACAAPGDGRRAREALAVIASAVLAAPPGPPQICKLRFHVLCNQAAAEHFAAGVPAVVDLAQKRFGSYNHLVVTLDFYEWTRKFPAPERFVALFKPCAVVKLFLPSLLAKNDTAGLGAAVYVDTDVLFLDDPQRVWVDAVGALAASGAVAAAAAEHGDLEAGCSSTDHFCAAALVEARATLALFTTRRALTLAPLFWYTGFAAPYQLDGFVDRFFRERVAGLELACFYSMEMVGAVLAGRLLDDVSRSPRANAKRVLAIFAAAAAGAYGVAAWLEARAAERADDDPVAVGFDASAACWLATTAVAALWGFADATIQTYCYWALGALYGAEADLARSVAFYKFVQSAGYCGGFALLPSSRCAYEAQLGLGAGAGALGVCLALLELPGDVR